LTSIIHRKIAADFFFFLPYEIVANSNGNHLESDDFSITDEQRQMPSDGKISLALWPGELKSGII